VACDDRGAVYERYNQPIISRRAYVQRQLRHTMWATLLLGGSLLVGTVGYMWLDDLPVVDAFVNAAMLLGGMGPVDPLKNDAAKWFAGIYALYSGIVFLVAVAVVAAPAVHRFLHRLNLDDGDDDASSDATPVPSNE
jgi:hypothetical protein